MPRNQQLLDRLYQIHQQRNGIVWIIHLSLVLISTIFHRQELTTSPLWWVSLLVLCLGLLVRSCFFNRCYDQWKRGTAWGISLNYIAILLVTLGWFLHFKAMYETWGPDSYRTSNTLLLIGGVVAGATATLAAHKPSFVLFSTVMCLGPASLFVLDGRTDYYSLVLTVGIYYIFSLYQNFLGHKQLLNSVDNELRAQEEAQKFKYLIDTVPGFVGVVDRSLTVTMANQAALFLFPEIVGKRLGEIDPDYGWEKSLIEFLESDKQTMVTEQHTRKDGLDIHALLNVHKTDNGFVLVSIIINDLVEAREKLKEQEAKAQYSARLASLGEMAAGIAHEVNNPLTIIQGGASMLEKLIEQEPVDRVSIRLMTEKIIRTTDRISRIIRSLRTLSRKGDQDPMADVNLRDLIETCLDVSSQKFKAYSIELQLPEFFVPVIFKGREVQLSQVLMNLVSNAIDAVKTLDERWIRIDFHQKQDSLEILVVDSGNGIPAELRQRIMDPFFTTKEVNQGTGLGLSISKSIVENHGGELNYLPDEPNTTFRITLPQR